MLRNYYINKEWMLSAKARRTYRTAASLALILVIAITAAPFAYRFSEAAFAIYQLAVFAGIVGAGITLVAMEYFWFGFDKSGDLKKLFWFVAMLAMPLLTPALYCLIVYSRMTKPPATKQQSANRATA